MAHCYVKENLERQNETTYEYLTELTEKEYKDSCSIYDELYMRNVSIVASQNAEDSKTDISEAKAYQEIFFWVIATGGCPNETKKVAITCIFGEDGFPQTKTYELEDEKGVRIGVTPRKGVMKFTAEWDGKKIEKIVHVK